MFAHNFARAIDVLTYNSNSGHNFYVATVQTSEGEMYLACLGGCVRWNKRLADALVGGGYFISQVNARQQADEMCRLYKDHDPKDVVIKQLDIDDAVSQLTVAFNQATSEMAKARELSKSQPRPSYYYETGN